MHVLQNVCATMQVAQLTSDYISAMLLMYPVLYLVCT